MLDTANAPARTCSGNGIIIMRMAMRLLDVRIWSGMAALVAIVAAFLDTSSKERGAVAALMWVHAVFKLRSTPMIVTMLLPPIVGAISWTWGTMIAPAAYVFFYIAYEMDADALAPQRARRVPTSGPETREKVVPNPMPLVVEMDDL